MLYEFFFPQTTLFWVSSGGQIVFVCSEPKPRPRGSGASGSPWKLQAPDARAPLGAPDLMLSARERVMEAEVRDHHEWQIPQGSSGWLPRPAQRSDAERPERAGWGWHDTDPMGRVPRQPGRAAADRRERVRPSLMSLFSSKPSTVDLTCV